MNINNKTVTGTGITYVKRSKAKPFLLKSIPHKLQKENEDEGWILDKVLKTLVRMRKNKKLDVLFEDEVWLTFANIGFTLMNKDRNFRIPYSQDGKLTQQIDVFAADDETILLIECKASHNIKKGNFKETIEALGGRKQGIIKELRKSFPNKTYKIKFIFATKNYIISEPDKDRLKKFDILHFDEDLVQYYSDLAKHLGHSARFQLLGNIFMGTKIPEMDNVVPAIEGSMGGYKYYSFSIEPEKLLKIGYVLHRNRANKNLMPTYQRIIKKTRLVKVQEFINKGGFFPNSIVINITIKNSSLRFDLANKQSKESISRIGLLHLPQKYCSAYIIDGQHRLYGYAESKYKSTNSIPVVAFVNLDRADQVKLFMDINENQKTVSKNLRNTLNSDLLWDSPDFNEQRRALKLQVAKSLGEEKSSPLYGRIVIGENKPQSNHYITIDTISGSLKMCSFFSRFKNNDIVKDGSFDRGNNDATFDSFYPFIEQSFNYIKNNGQCEWNKTKKENGYLMTNAGIHSLIRIFNDIIIHLREKGIIKPKTDKTSFLINEMSYYLDALIEYFKTMSPDEADILRTSYGVAGRTKYWRTLQKNISFIRPDFKPEGLETYWEDNEKRFNVQSYEMIMDIEKYLKDDFEKKLKSKYGAQWFREGLPRSVYDSANKLASDKNYENTNVDKITEPWNCLVIINYREIAIYGSNWSELFADDYTRPGEEKISGGKNAKTKWFYKLSKIRNENSHTYSVTKEEYEFLKDIYNWLIVEKVI